MKHDVEYTNSGIKVSAAGQTYNIGRGRTPEQEREMIEDCLAMIERDAEHTNFYSSEHFINEFNEKLETAILATRGGGSGAVACRDTLLSLYNGNAYPANLSNWYNLDSTNRAALLFVLEHQTANNRQDIDLYLPQYASDFTRMKNEVE